ncbi:MAG: hypothetical protein V3V10_06220 [Planctomycetota bacterium]
MYDSHPKILTLLFVLALIAGSVSAQSDEVKQLVLKLDNPRAAVRGDALMDLLDLEDIDRDLRLSFRATSDIETRVQLIEIVSMRDSDVLVADALKLLNDDEFDRVAAAAREYLVYAESSTVQKFNAVLESEYQAEANKLLTFRLRMEIFTELLHSHLMPGDFIGKFNKLEADEDLRNRLFEILRVKKTLLTSLERAVSDLRESEYDYARIDSTGWRKFLRVQDGLPSAFLALQSNIELENIRKVSGKDLQASINLVQGVRRAAARALGLTNTTTGSTQTNEELKVLYNEFMEFSPNPALHHLINMSQLREELEVSMARLGSPELLNARIGRLETVAKRALKQDHTAINVRITARPDLQSLNQIGHLQHRAGDHKAAEATWSKLLKELELHFRTPSNSRRLSSLSSMLSVVYYNLACAQSVQVKPSRSLQNLKKAVSHGYKDYAWITVDGDLESLRDTPAFKKWFNDHAPPSLVTDFSD